MRGREERFIRVWDVHPGYLSRTRLLGEHREIHAAWTVITEDKKGYSNHPDVVRWRGNLARLRDRHTLVVNEMLLRGYNHFSPLPNDENKDSITTLEFVDPPHLQFGLLAAKYGPEERGRIPLPKLCSDFWAHHKYAVMARGYDKYKHVSELSKGYGSKDIANAEYFVLHVYGILAEKPDLPNLRNSWEHVLGYFKQDVSCLVRRQWHRKIETDIHSLSIAVYQRALELGLTYIKNSTVLSDNSY